LFFESSLGIDIKSSSLALVHIKRPFQEIKLGEYALYSLEEDKHRDEIQKATAELIRNFIHKNRIKAETIFLGLPRDHVLLKFLELPLAVRENLRDTLNYEIEKYIPFPADDLYFDYQILGTDKSNNRIKLLLFAVKKNMLTPFLELGKKANVSFSGIEINSTALANYFSLNEVGSDGSCFAIADIGSDYLELDMVKEGRLLYSKHLKLKGINSSSLANLIFEELKLASLMISKDYPDFGIPPNKFNLVLSGSKVDDEILQNLTKNEEINISPMESIENFNIPYGLMSAFGLALKGIAGLPNKINLAPAESLKEPSKSGRNIFFTLSILAILSGLGWGGSYLAKKKIILNRLNSQTAILKPSIAQLEKLKKEFYELEKKVDYLDSLGDRKRSILRILNELTRIIPESSWIKNFTYQDTTLEIEGYAESASELIPLLENSSLFKGVRFKSTIVKDKGGKERYKIGMDLLLEDRP